MATTPTQSLAPSPQAQAHHGHGSRGGRAGHFVRHFVEMCAAMCIGEAALDATMLAAAAILFGYADPFRQIPAQFPELSVLVVAFNMTVPMAAWMRFRGMAWRPTTEMSAAMLVLALVLIGFASLGILDKSSLILCQEGLMMPVMLIPMLFRLDAYAGPSSHQAQIARATGQEAAP